MMRSQTHDARRIELERGQLWDQAIAHFDAGERGVEAKRAIDEITRRLQARR